MAHCQWRLSCDERHGRASAESAHLDDPSAVLGIVFDLEARIVVVKQLLVVLELFRLAPLS